MRLRLGVCGHRRVIRLGDVQMPAQAHHPASRARPPVRSVLLLDLQYRRPGIAEADIGHARPGFADDEAAACQQGRLLRHRVRFGQHDLDRFGDQRALHLRAVGHEPARPVVGAGQEDDALAWPGRAADEAQNVEHRPHEAGRIRHVQRQQVVGEDPSEGGRLDHLDIAFQQAQAEQQAALPGGQPVADETKPGAGQRAARHQGRRQAVVQEMAVIVEPDAADRDCDVVAQLNRLVGAPAPAPVRPGRRHRTAPAGRSTRGGRPAPATARWVRRTRAPCCARWSTVPTG